MQVPTTATAGVKSMPGRVDWHGGSGVVGVGGLNTKKIADSGTTASVVANTNVEMQPSDGPGAQAAKA